MGYAIVCDIYQVRAPSQRLLNGLPIVNMNIHLTVPKSTDLNSHKRTSSVWVT